MPISALARQRRPDVGNIEMVGPPLPKKASFNPPSPDNSRLGATRQKPAQTFCHGALLNQAVMKWSMNCQAYDGINR